MSPKLKSLELHGYKTFATRTLLEFPAAITAIVGPNGSGKSNVADSIRWVLGEQAFSLLRGRKTEDMIYSGSEQRARASMASSSITFDNEDGWLPIDFSEVILTRRAYRDGQNEYFLNGQRVRLREISELLAKSGLAERTYTIIGQGLVDTALSIKPEERRRFFEEAAGIGLYRGRREEALQRLEKTTHNLERVKDILSELEPRLRSLERQAKRAQEFKQIKADLDVLLRDWYGYYWHHTQKDLNHAKELLRQQSAKLRQAKAEQDKAEKDVQTARDRLQALRSELNQWHVESADLHREQEKVSRSLAVMDERYKSLLDQQQGVESELNRLEEEQTGRKERIQSFEEERKQLEAEMADAQARAAEAQKMLQERQSERRNAEAALRDARNALVAVETRKVQLSAQLQELTNRLEELKRSQNNLKQAVENEKSTFETAQKKLGALIREREKFEIDYEEAQEAIAGLQEKLNGLETTRKKHVEERNRMEAERSKLVARIEVLEQAERSMSGLNQGAKFLMEAAQKGRIKGKLRAFSSILEVKAEYEQAIAAALGDFLDGVILDEEMEAETLLEMLSDGEKGRAVMLSPREGDGGREAAPLPNPDVLGWASSFVKASERYQSIIQQLLGSVVLVKDRSAARKVLSELPDSVRAVTLRGEVFWGSQVVMAGQDGKASKIARPRQQRELQSQVDDLDYELDRTSEALDKLKKEISALQEEEQKGRKNAQDINQNLNRALKAQQQANLELEQVRQRSKWQRDQLAAGEEQIRKAQERISQIEKELESIEKSIGERNEQVREHNRDLHSLPLDDAQNQVSHWQTNLAVTTRAIKELDRRMEEARGQLSASQNRKMGLYQRQASIAVSQEALEAEKRDLRQEEARLSLLIDELSGKITPAENELVGLEHDYTAMMKSLATAQQTATIAERHESQAQHELTRQREALESLRQKIEDDFGLVEFEYSENISGPTPLPLGEMVAQLPVVEEISEGLEESIKQQRGMLRRLGAINPEAQTEYESVNERYHFLVTQVDDLKKADADLREVIQELDELMRIEFRKTFDAVAAEFKKMFTRLFGGGSAKLELVNEEDISNAGIDIEARLPGRREQGLSLLSGGERSLTAVALIFALLRVSPTPFCVLDEVDAALDEANVGRFCDLLRELSENTQFIVITHNRNTVQASDVIYGITMGRDSASQMISLKLDEITEEMVR